MVTRAEAAAMTRRALLEAAAALLDEGGPDAVTLRDVGARAGVSRGAPYGHFTNKEELLTMLAAQKWEQMGEGVRQLREEVAVSAGQRLHAALSSVLEVARQQPHLYALMFTAQSRASKALVEAASATQDEFLAIVSEVVEHDDPRPIGALLLATAHGIAGMELSGHLGTDKWAASADDLVAMMVQRVMEPGREEVRFYSVD